MSKVYFIFCISNLLGLTVFSQSVDSSLARYSTEFAPERAYIHYDKPSYSPGETIWFKVYLMEGAFPAESSKTFYIDWTDQNGALIGRSISPIFEGVTNGQFEVPDSLSGRYIHARGYTKWMLNFDSSFFYNKDIPAASHASTLPDQDAGQHYHYCLKNNNQAYTPDHADRPLAANG